MSHPLTSVLLAALAGYLAGSLSTAIVVCRLFALDDPRSAGSRNAGATNVLRLGGRLPGLLTLTGDVAKGVIPLVIADHFGATGTTLTAIGLAAVLGHLLPVFHGFRGGKGVATGLGVLAVWYWPAAVAFSLTWLTVAAVMRVSSLASISGCLVAIAWTAWTGSDQWLPVSLLCGLILLRHHHNLLNLLRGEEPRIGQRR